VLLCVAAEESDQDIPGPLENLSLFEVALGTFPQALSPSPPPLPAD